MADIFSNLQALMDAVGVGELFRKRKKPRKINCPHPDYRDAYVVLPAEWQGKHARLRSEAIDAIGEGKPSEYYNTTIALLIADDWGNIEGLEGDDPTQWNLEVVPIPVITWLTREVINDFNAAYRVPKN